MEYGGGVNYDSSFPAASICAEGSATIDALSITNSTIRHSASNGMFFRAYGNCGSIQSEFGTPNTFTSIALDDVKCQ